MVTFLLRIVRCLLLIILFQLTPLFLFAQYHNTLLDFEKKNDFESAIRFIERTDDSAPDDVAIVFTKIRIYRKAAYDLSPENPNAKKWLGEAIILLNNLSSQISLPAGSSEIIESEYKGVYRAYLQKAVDFIDNRELSKALNTFDLLEYLLPGDSLSLHMHTLVAYQNENISSAVKSAKKLDELGKLSKDIVMLMLQIHSTSDSLSRNYSYWQNQLTHFNLMPDEKMEIKKINDRFYLYLAKSYLESKDIQASLNALKKTLPTDDSDIITMLLQLQYSQQNKTTLEDLFEIEEKTLTITNKTIVLQSIIDFNLANYRFKKKILERLDDDNSVAHYHYLLGEYYRINTRYSLARLAYQKAINSEPLFFEALKGMTLSIDALVKISTSEFYRNWLITKMKPYLNLALDIDNKDEQLLELARKIN